MDKYEQLYEKVIDLAVKYEEEGIFSEEMTDRMINDINNIHASIANE